MWPAPVLVSWPAGGCLPSRRRLRARAGTVATVPSVDVITAAGPGTHCFLPQAAESLALLLPVEGWSVRWLVVCDGPDAEDNRARCRLAEGLGASVSLANPDRCWAGASRNRALAHSTGDYVTCLDADDTLLPGALRSWSSAALQSPGWVAFRALDWYPEVGRVRAFPPPFDLGHVRAGSWLDYFERHGRHPAVPAAVLWPQELLAQVGGWSASPVAEDALPCIVATSVRDGWWSGDTTYLYRKHDGQITARGSSRLFEQVAADARRLACLQARARRV